MEKKGAGTKPAEEEAPLPAAPGPAAKSSQKRSITSVKSRKSAAASVFLLPNLSVTNRLGRHLQVEKYDDYGRPSEAEDHKKKAQKRKKCDECKLKCDECKLFCCDRANKKCMGKNAFSWVVMMTVLFIFWSFLILLMYAFFVIFLAIEGNLPRNITTTTPLKERTPMLVDFGTVEKNVDKGWQGEKNVFPFRFGSQLFFPGTSPLTVDVYGLDHPDKEKRDLVMKYEDEPVFTFETDKITGIPTKDFEKRQLGAYQYFFDEHYKTRTADANLDMDCNRFRKPDDSSANCPWPASKDTTRDSFKPVYTPDKSQTKIYYPVLFFTVNTMFGWVPQIKGLNKTGRILCELDMDDVKNKGLSSSDFEGVMDCENSATVVNSGVAKDFCGIRLARFPFYGQPDVKSPIIRYEIKKMPTRINEPFVIKCRLHYDGFEKQRKSLGYPFNFREERMWTKITIKRVEVEVSP